MEGTPFRTSAVKRTMLPHLLRPYSARKTPAPIPSGTPIMLAVTSNITEPTIALATPPPISPIGLGICVRKSQFSPPTPRTIMVPRIRNNGTVTISAPSVISPRATILVSLRRREMVVGINLGNGPRRHSARDRPDQQSGQCVHNQRNHKQNQRHFHQCALVSISYGFRELIGDH